MHHLPPRPSSASSGPRPVAVVPFVNLSADPADDWMGQGVAEALAVGLEGLGVRVIRLGPSADSAHSLEGRPQPDAGDAAIRVCGTYALVEDRLRLRASLIDTRTGVVVATVGEEGGQGRSVRLAGSCHRGAGRCGRRAGRRGDREYWPFLPVRRAPRGSIAAGPCRHVRLREGQLITERPEARQVGVTACAGALLLPRDVSCGFRPAQDPSP